MYRLWKSSAGYCFVNRTNEKSRNGFIFLKLTWFLSKHLEIYILNSHKHDSVIMDIVLCKHESFDTYNQNLCT